MKVWAGIFNFLGIVMIVYMLVTWHTNMDAAKVDYDTERLRIATDYASDAAMIKLLDNAQNLDNDYTNIVRNIKITPDDSLKIFETLICYNYGMDVNEENLRYIEGHIPSAILACTDGYYITELAPDEYGNLRFQWSMKKPYTSEADRLAGNLIAYTIDGENCVRLRLNSDGRINTSFDTDYKAVSKEIAAKAVNNTLTNALTYSVANVNKARGITEYNIYLPIEQTASGINSINGQSLIIILQGGDFVGNARVSGATITGMKIVKSRTIIGFEMQKLVNGVWQVDSYGNNVYEKLYCYADELPNTSDLLTMGLRVRNIRIKSTAKECAESGYNPCIQFNGAKAVCFTVTKYGVTNKYYVTDRQLTPENRSRLNKLVELRNNQSYIISDRKEMKTMSISDAMTEGYKYLDIYSW